MEQKEFTWMGALMVFWAITWRTFAIALPVAILVGVIVGVVGFSSGLEKEVAVGYANILGQIIVIPIYIYVLKRLFTKGFGKYRLAVMDKD